MDNCVSQEWRVWAKCYFLELNLFFSNGRDAGGLFYPSLRWIFLKAGGEKEGETYSLFIF
ncbi:MAG TPA: hypothetical protein DCR93_19350 [Cytophagales bacterium]|nr:hypothetical protein [Cytophagales bacterium]